jgi:hypothetical protein
MRILLSTNSSFKMRAFETRRDVSTVTHEVWNRFLFIA